MSFNLASILLTHSTAQEPFSRGYSFPPHPG